MRLSEAIRKGCEGMNQIKFNLTDGGRGVCAVGAIGRAHGINHTGQWPDEVLKQLSKRANHPVLNRIDYLNMIIVDLNNVQDWSFQRIADWVESIEREAEGARITSPETREERVHATVTCEASA